MKTRPVARFNGTLVESVGDETVVYDLDSKEAHCLKPLAAAVFMYADGNNTIAEIAELAAYRLETPVTESEAADVIAQLEERSLIELPAPAGMTRRSAMLKLSTVAGAAAAAPLIVSIIAPTPAAAGTPIATGDCCGKTTDPAPANRCTGLNSSCQSNHCCQNIGGPGHECNPCKCVGDRNDCSVAQCSRPKGTCPDLLGVAACAQTAGGKCCYLDAQGDCCTVFVSAGGGNIQC